MPAFALTRLRQARRLCAAAALLCLPAAAQFVNPVSTAVGVQASAASTDAHTPIVRFSNGSGPIADAASALHLSSTADAAASVDAAGLHASAVVHSAANLPGWSAAARSSAGLVNPFIVVPQAGFTGSQALLRIPFSFSGSINLLPSLALCSSCFGLVQADLGVDGMSEQFHFLGAASQGTVSNPSFVSGGVARGGMLEGLVPVNTELYLRAGLLTQVHCQSFAIACGAQALFGGTLRYDGFSPDAVSIVWGLAPAGVTPVPEPSTWLLMAGGLVVAGRLARQRRVRIDDGTRRAG